MANSLRDQILAYAKQNKIDRIQVARYVSINISRDIVNNTPVDEGRARSNWYASNSGSSNQTTESNKRDSLANVRKKFDGAAKKYGTYYFTNNLPYARALEYGEYKKNPIRGTRNRLTGIYEIRTRNGYSKQAPRGMVRIAILRQKRNFNKVLNNDKIITARSGKRYWG